MEPCSCMSEEHSGQGLRCEQYAKCVQRHKPEGTEQGIGVGGQCIEETASRSGRSLKALEGLIFTYVNDF